MGEKAYPQPTAKELRQLQKIFGNWEECSELQRAICVVFLRGTSEPKKIAKQLDDTVETIVSACPGVQGFLIDAKTKKLFLP